MEEEKCLVESALLIEVVIFKYLLSSQPRLILYLVSFFKRNVLLEARGHRCFNIRML